MRLAFFITCLTDQFYPRAGLACCAVLKHLGHEVIFPQAQTCCGQPMYNTGYHDQARDLARHTLNVFEEFDHVVTPSGSCCAMLREHYAPLFEADPAMAARAERLAGKTYEFVEFLTRELGVDVAKLGLREGRAPQTATYHPSCHLRPLGLTGETPALLTAMGGFELKPLGHADECCGFGGLFAVKFPEISGAMAREKAREVERTGAATLICNDAGCAMNIEGACRREGVKVRVKHAAELIAEELGLRIEPAV